MVRIRRLRVLLGRSQEIGKVGIFHRVFGLLLDQPITDVFAALSLLPVSPLRIRQSIAVQCRNDGGKSGNPALAGVIAEIVNLHLDSPAVAACHRILRSRVPASGNPLPSSRSCNTLSGRGGFAPTRHQQCNRQCRSGSHDDHTNSPAVAFASTFFIR